MEAEQNKSIVRGASWKSRADRKETVELAKDSAYHAQKAKRHLAAEVERARDVSAPGGH